VYGAGTIVAGKYRLEHLLGQGGMGVVMAATHLQLGTAVALKVLHEDMFKNPGIVERFMREARASAQLRGENVCRVSDVGTLDNGVPFIVMELLSGYDLATILRTNGAVPASSVVEIVMQACLALGEAHALGIVHRDLKPGNLFWTQRPDGSVCVKVLDFGVAKAPEDVNFNLTQTSSVIGSPGYMSPEQLKSSRAVDARSDIWALGVVMYELVSGQKPFRGESITELALRVAMDPTPPLSGVVSAPFESVIGRCLEKDPSRRFQDVAELAAALAPFAGPRGMEYAYGVARVLRGAHTPVVPAVGSPPTTPTTLRGASGMVSGNRTSGRRWKLPAIIGGGAALGVVLALLVVGASKNSGTETAAGETKTMSSPPEKASAEPGASEAAKAEAAQPDAVKAETPNVAKADAAKADAAKLEAENAAKADAEKKHEAEKAAKAEAAKAKLEAEKAARAEATAKLEADKAAKAEAAKAKLEAEKVAKAEAAAKREAEKAAKAEAARVARAEAAKAKAEKAEAARAAKAKAEKAEAGAKTTTSATKPPEDVGDSRF
jgi:serine/threonine-protein kinase